MKTTRLSILGLCLALASATQAQTVSTLESISVQPDSFLNGQEAPLGTIYASGNASFLNYYDTAWGGFWTGGFAISSVEDSTTAGFANLYGARAGEGAEASANYAVGQQGAKVRLTGAAAGGAVKGVYITNSTYAALSMREGDGFAKKFGGTSGNDPDFFILTIKGWSGGNVTSDSISFHLADFTDSNNENDYIVTDWRWVDLTPLGNVDSLSFNLWSSDVGGFGINTPLFYCLDNLTTWDAPLVETTIDGIPAYVFGSDTFVMMDGEYVAYEQGVTIGDVPTHIIGGDTFVVRNGVFVPITEITVDGKVAYVIEGDTFEVFGGQLAPLGVEGVATKPLHFYPNPAKDVLALDNIENGTVHIRDLRGAVLSTERVSDNRINLNISALTAGTYILQFESEERHEIVKFVKQ